MSERVLLVEDQVGDVTWLIDLIHSRGYDVVLATNEEAARARLDAVRNGTESYVLAIIDVMVAVKDLMDLVNLDEKFFADSEDTGIRLCRYAREKLTEEHLFIVCLTVREDEKVKTAMQELGIPLFNKAPQSREEDIRGFLMERLPSIEALNPRRDLNPKPRTPPSSGTG